MSAPAGVHAEPTSAGAPLVQCRDLVHVYQALGVEVAALRGVDLEIERGESVALLGPSGSGKTTLLWQLAGLLRPTAGSVTVAGVELSRLAAASLVGYRRRTVGVVLQDPARNLLAYDSAVGNVTFAATGLRRGAALRRARELLAAVGLSAVAGQRAGRLSGGEQQRLALAVALVNEPPLLLADEPTSQLDPRSAEAVLELLAGLGSERGTTVLAVTHDDAVATALGHTVAIRDGRVSAAGRAGQAYLLVARDGSVALPPEALAELPPGSRVRALTRSQAVELRRMDPS